MFLRCLQKSVLSSKTLSSASSPPPLRYPDTADTAAAINQLGCKHVSKGVGESHVDEKNKLVTTCAFMCNAPIHEIFDGIGSMVQGVLKLA